MSSYVRIECNLCGRTLVVEEDEQLAIAEVGDVVERHCVACGHITGCEVLADAPPQLVVAVVPNVGKRSKR